MTGKRPAKKKAGKKPGTAVAKGGRPTAYKDEYAADAEKLCLLGATDADMADFFDVAEATISNWRNAHPEFLESIKRGKAKADATVADRLFKRATGYKHRAVKILTVSLPNKGGSEVEQVPYVEHYPPDTAAAIFWLKNRRPDLWRDKQEITVVSSDVQTRLRRQAEVIASRETWATTDLFTALDAVWQ